MSWFASACAVDAEQIATITAMSNNARCGINMGISPTPCKAALAETEALPESYAWRIPAEQALW